MSTDFHSATVTDRHTAYERVGNRLEENGLRVLDMAAGWMRCARRVRTAKRSLSVYGEPGRVRIRCWAGCDNVTTFCLRWACRCVT